MYLISEIRKRKYLESDVAINEIVVKNNLKNDAFIYALTMSKKDFKEETDVREYLQCRLYDYFMITQDEDNYYVDILNITNLDLDLTVEIEIRRGVIVKAAPFKKYTEFLFDDKSSSEKLVTEIPDVIMVARVAEGIHPKFGKVKITEEMLKSFEKNFNNKVHGIDLAINEDHEKKEAFGWYKEVFLSEDKQELYAKVKWNKKGTVSLNEGEYRYFSPEYREKYIHNLDGKEYGPTLVGGALTNYPFLKMDAIVELNEGEKKVNEEQLKELNDKNAELSTSLKELSEKLEKGLKHTISLNEKIEELEKEKAQLKKEKDHEKLFLEKKINKAQLVALNEGKSMVEVLALAETLNFNEKGETVTREVDTVELSDADKKACDAFGIKYEDYAKTNK